MRTVAAISIMALIMVSPAWAEPYEVTYYPPGAPYLNGQDPVGPFPEHQGWDRYSRFGTVERSIQEAALVLAAQEPLDWEYYKEDMHDNLNPEVGEFFYFECRVVVTEAISDTDTSVGVALDQFAGVLSITFSTDYVRDAEGFEWYWYSPGIFHTFLLRSPNLVDYDLFVDGDYAFSDVFKVPTSLNSFVGWGDTATGTSSSRWEFFRFGSARLGDINTDGSIDLNDFATFARCFGGSGVVDPPAGCSDQEFVLSDLDGNGAVDLNDFSTFANNFTG